MPGALFDTNIGLASVLLTPDADFRRFFPQGLQSTALKAAYALHAPPVLPPHFKQRMRDLPQAAAAHRVHQHFKDVLVGHHGLLQALQYGRGGAGVAGMEVSQALQLGLLFFFGAARHLVNIEITIARRTRGR